jgi:hypothetical protein
MLGEFLGHQPVCRNLSKAAFGWVDLKFRIIDGSWLALQNDISSGNYSSVYINVLIKFNLLRHTTSTIAHWSH